MVREWELRLSKDAPGRVTAWLLEVRPDGQWGSIDLEEFGPFCTALEVAQWLTRHWAPRANLSLR